jgi:hypothetical protein
MTRRAAGGAAFGQSMKNGNAPKRAGSRYFDFVF